VQSLHLSDALQLRCYGVPTHLYLIRLHLSDALQLRCYLELAARCYTILRCIYPMHCNYVATPSIKRFGIEEDQGRFSRTSQICALRCVTLDTMPSLSPSKSFPYAFREPPGILPEPQVRGKSVQIIYSGRIIVQKKPATNATLHRRALAIHPP